MAQCQMISLHQEETNDFATMSFYVISFAHAAFDDCTNITIFQRFYEASLIPSLQKKTQNFGYMTIFVFSLKGFGYFFKMSIDLHVH